MFNKRVFQFSVQKLWPAAAACNQHKRIPRPTDFLYKSSGGELAMHISKKHRPKKEGRLGLKWSRIITSPQQKSDYKNATFLFFIHFLCLEVKPAVPPWYPCSSWMHYDTLTESNHILGDILCQDAGDFCRVGSPWISGRTWWDFCKDVLTSAVLNWCPDGPKTLTEEVNSTERPTYNIHQHHVSKYILFWQGGGKLPAFTYSTEIKM